LRVGDKEDKKESVDNDGNVPNCFLILFKKFFRRKTDVTIPIDHFEKFYIHVDTRIVISLRELRSILHFGNICGFTLNLHFDRPGRPMIVAIDENMDLTAEFVLATMDDFDAQPQTQHTSSQQNQVLILNYSRVSRDTILVDYWLMV